MCNAAADAVIATGTRGTSAGVAVFGGSAFGIGFAARGKRALPLVGETPFGAIVETTTVATFTVAATHADTVRAVPGVAKERCAFANTAGVQGRTLSRARHACSVRAAVTASTTVVAAQTRLTEHAVVARWGAGHVRASGSVGGTEELTTTTGAAQRSVSTRRAIGALVRTLDGKRIHHAAFTRRCTVEAIFAAAVRTTGAFAKRSVGTNGRTIDRRARAHRTRTELATIAVRAADPARVVSADFAAAFVKTLNRVARTTDGCAGSAAGVAAVLARATRVGAAGFATAVHRGAVGSGVVSAENNLTFGTAHHERQRTERCPS